MLPWAILLVAICALGSSGSSFPEPRGAPVTEPLSEGPAPIAELRAANGACAFCSDSLDLPTIPLRHAQVASRGEALSEENRNAIARIDSLLQCGYFGPPEGEGSRREAQRALKLVLRNVFDYIADLAGADGFVYETDERELLRPLADTFLNVGVYPIRMMDRGRIGCGGYCLQFGLDGKDRGMIAQGGGLDDLVLDEIEFGSQRSPALRLDFAVKEHGSVELVYQSRCCGQISRHLIVDRGDTLDLVVLRGLEGSYVRKAGMHRMGGIAYWRGRLPRGRWDPQKVRVGAVAYFPRIKFRLPFFLPDLGLEDLREFNLPHPFWAVSDVNGVRHLPDWVEVSPAGFMGEWEGEGPRPRILEEVFPDL